MRDPWQILRDGGLPIASARSGSRPTADELAIATRTAISSEPRGRDAEALAAFLFAWRHHWPSAFARAYGGDAEAVLAWAARNAHDADRYIKLRRIAVENLAEVL